MFCVKLISVIQHIPCGTLHQWRSVEDLTTHTIFVFCLDDVMVLS